MEDKKTYVCSVDKIKEFHQWLINRIRIAEEMKLLSLSERKITLQRFDEIFVLNTHKKYGVWK